MPAHAPARVSRFHSIITSAFASASCITVVPVQDWLGLGSDGRMNTPSRATRNWNWRFRREQRPPELPTRGEAC
ncbi:MAG: 4-alpha-glucanotransferase [Gammaproteobacteria bacterium]